MHLTDMWTTLFLVLVFRTAVLSSPSNPINVTIASKNFINILQWSPGPDTPADTKYSVRYAIYGDSLGLEKQVRWRPVLHCTEISRTWCDLSVETSDLEHGYFARVRALSRKGNSKWVETPMRFDPMIETEFGPPDISVDVHDKYVIINMKGPMRYLPHNHTPQVPMATLYPHLSYKLSIHNTHSGIIRYFTLKSNQFKYHIMDHGVEYCFSANTKIEDRLIPSKHHSSAWHCIATPKDRLVEIVLISTTLPVLLLCLLIVGGYLLHKYLSGKDQKSPYILNQPTSFPQPLTLTSDHFNIIVISVDKDEVPVNKFYPKLPNSPIEYPEEGYKKKEWQVKTGFSAGTYASQNSVLQTPLVHPMSLDKSGESHQDLRSLQENSQTLQLQFNQNESSNDIERANVISSMGYASQSDQAIQPINQPDDLPDDYGFVVAEGPEVLPFQEQEDEHTGFLHLDWSPTSRTLLIPGLDLGIGQRAEGGGRPNLGTVFVRQPSEEDALIGPERSGSVQWDPEEFMAKWDLIVSND